MSYFFQLVASGIVVGSIYALSGLGFVLIYKSSRVLNLAHGQFIALGAFITYALTVWVAYPHLHLVFTEPDHHLPAGHERGTRLFATLDR